MDVDKKDAGKKQWTAKMVIYRLKEAAATLRALRSPGVQPSGYTSNWPDVIHRAMDAYGCHNIEIKPLQPSPVAIKRMDEALGWLEWLEPAQTRLVWFHAEGVPRKTILKTMELSRTTLWRLWNKAITVIVNKLNGGSINT